MTALQEAARGGHDATALLLLDAGAAPNQSYTDEAGAQQNLLFDMVRPPALAMAICVTSQLFGSWPR
jgi:ankyrin repeat protein